MNAYCERQGMTNGSVRFVFDGTQLTADGTPIEVGLKCFIFFITYGVFLVKALTQYPP